MANDPLDDLLKRMAEEARTAGLIVRCEDYGVLAMVHPRHGKAEQTDLGIEAETD